MLTGKRVGFVLTGSHCTMGRVLPEIARLVAAGADLTPILSPAAATVDTRYGTAADLRANLAKLTGHEPWTAFTEVEPIGPQKLLDIVVVAPCTGNTLAKLAAGISDTPATMAVKAHLRNGRPVVVAVASNDGLGANAKNIGLLLNTKNFYFVPFGQDSPTEKPNSLDARLELLTDTVAQALVGRQLQPVLIERWR
ncbi:MAG: dipicolinate synthase subunit B [Chloroflexota bacterium]